MIFVPCCNADISANLSAFPTAIEDGVDATRYIVDHADELKIDPSRIAFSGFSAGGNMTFSVPFRILGELKDARTTEPASAPQDSPSLTVSGTQHQGTVVAIVAWYPSFDYTKPRAERRASNVRPEKEMLKAFSDLFDASYLHPWDDLDRTCPWLSPGVAPDSMVAALPDTIIMRTSEWDGLLKEAEQFRDRIFKDFPHKQLSYKNIPRTVHGFDKTVNPIRWNPDIEYMYREVCEELRAAFEPKDQT